MDFLKLYKNYIYVLILFAAGFLIFMFTVKTKDSSGLLPHDEIRMEKIDADIWKAFDQDEDGKIRIIVYLTQQANLSEISIKGLGNTKPEKNQDRESRKEIVFDTLTTLASKTQKGVLNHLGESKSPVNNTKTYWIFNGFVTDANKKTVVELASLQEVGHIYLDKTVQLSPVEFVTKDLQEQNINLTGLPWGIKKIQADQVWQQFGDTGTGVVVGSIDSGIQWEHPALKNQYRGWDGKNIDSTYSWFDTVNHRAYPYDDQGHGTHAMGIIVGDDGSGNHIGVAPGAKWIAVKALDSSGGGLISNLLEAMQWMLAPGGDPAKAPDIVNNSWGSPTCEKTFMTALQSWRAAGIIPVFAGGNSGVKGEGTIGTPACYPGAIAVGATDSDDTIATFSSQGPSPMGIIKPDISAPGVKILSALNSLEYGYKSGTSMAAPYVSGVIALVKSANPSLTIEEIETALKDTAIDLGVKGQDNTFGWGRVNALDVVKVARKDMMTLIKNYDDTDSGIIYSDSWERLDKCDLCFKNSLHISRNMDSTARLTFYGDSFILINTYGPIFGEIHVNVDGRYQEDINLNTPFMQWEKRWNSPKLNLGKHTLTLSHSSGTLINLDGIVVIGTPSQ